MTATHWENWSGAVQCDPARFVKPESIAAVRELVRSEASAGRTIRVVGSGHSFTRLVQTDETLVSLDHISGLEDIDQEALRATALAGTKLWNLNELLEAEGLAMENLGDINRQSIAGATGTGTHGTGERFGNISSQSREITLVTAEGELLTCSETENPDVFKAAQVSLGSLGIVVRIRLQLQRLYRLHYVRRKATVAEMTERLPELTSQNRHFEAYYFPYTETVQLKLLNETDAPVDRSGPAHFLNDILLENVSFGALSASCRALPRLCAPVSRLCAKMVSEGEVTDVAHRVFSTHRLVRFNEMEYSLPREAGMQALQEIKRWIVDKQIAVHFPIEIRFVKGDDIWLSPSYQRDTCYIAVHMFRGMPYKEYFRGVEDIFKAHGGRPHWGKMHTRTAAELRELYPKWDDFHAVRRRLDPDGLFLNPYLRELFGE